jgi:hypothetical protein
MFGKFDSINIARAGVQDVLPSRSAPTGCP